MICVAVCMVWKLPYQVTTQLIHLLVCMIAHIGGVTCIKNADGWRVPLSHALKCNACTTQPLLCLLGRGIRSLQLSRTADGWRASLSHYARIIHDWVFARTKLAISIMHRKSHMQWILIVARQDCCVQHVVCQFEMFVKRRRVILMHVAFSAHPR